MGKSHQLVISLFLFLLAAGCGPGDTCPKPVSCDHVINENTRWDMTMYTLQTDGQILIQETFAQGYMEFWSLGTFQLWLDPYPTLAIIEGRATVQFVNDKSYLYLFFDVPWPDVITYPFGKPSRLISNSPLPDDCDLSNISFLPLDEPEGVSRYPAWEIRINGPNSF